MISVDKIALLPKIVDLFGFNLFYIVLNAKFLLSKFYSYNFALWFACSSDQVLGQKSFVDKLSFCHHSTGSSYIEATWAKKIKNTYNI